MKSINPIPAALVALCLLAPGVISNVTAHERKEREHDTIREALKRGEVLPLTKVLAIAEERVPGEIVEVELEHNKQGVLIYDIKVLAETGRVREIKIDARTGVVLKIEDD